MTIRIITNDSYASDPCVMDEADFYAQANELGWENADFDDAGPVVTSEADIREWTCEDEADPYGLISMFRAIQSA